MRRIISSVVVTLDGFMEGPNGAGDIEWSGPYVDDIAADAIRLLSAANGGILLGRVTYEGFRTYWPFETGELADLMNTPPKYVVGSPGSMAETPWGELGNAQPIDRDVEARVRALKEQDGNDLVILASGGLASSLLDLGLVDEVQLLVVPLVLGNGKPYLHGISHPVALQLIDTNRYPLGSINLTYRAAS